MSVRTFLLRNTVAEKPELCGRIRACVGKKGLGSSRTLRKENVLFHIWWPG